MSDDESRLDRRSVLRNVGATAGAVLALSAPAVADPDPDIICGYDCYNTGAICEVGPEYTYEVVECCQYPDGSVDCTSYYTCGCPTQCNC